MGWATVPMVGGIVLLCFLGRALDALAMGDDEAQSLGVPVKAVRLATIATATLVSALTVSIAGMIGWIGLIVPHIARLLVGPGNARLLPALTPAAIHRLYGVQVDLLRTADNRGIAFRPKESGVACLP